MQNIIEMNVVEWARDSIVMSHGGPVGRTPNPEPPALFHAFLSVRIGFREVTVKIEDFGILSAADHHDKLANLKRALDDAAERLFGPHFTEPKPPTPSLF